MEVVYEVHGRLVREVYVVSVLVKEVEKGEKGGGLMYTELVCSCSVRREYAAFGSQNGGCVVP